MESQPASFVHASLLRRCLAALALTSALLAATTAACGAADSHEIVVQTEEGPRTALVLPAQQGPQPTIIVLHGATMTAQSTVRNSGFAEAAARSNFAAVFPQGKGRQWNDGRAGGPGGADDVAFLNDLVSRLVADGIAAPGHIYLAGISNGGMMSFTMVCRAGNLFRGIGTVVANMPDGIEPCHPPAMPVVMINGTADPMVPYDGGGVGLTGHRGEVWSVQRTAELFIHANGCKDQAEQPLPARNAMATTKATEITWSPCQSGKPVTLYRIDGGGHQIAGEQAFLPRLLGESNRDFSAADVILKAFVTEEGSGSQL